MKLLDGLFLAVFALSISAQAETTIANKVFSSVIAKEKSKQAKTAAKITAKRSAADQAATYLIDNKLSFAGAKISIRKGSVQLNLRYLTDKANDDKQAAKSQINLGASNKPLSGWTTARVTAFRDLVSKKFGAEAKEREIVMFMIFIKAQKANAFIKKVSSDAAKRKLSLEQFVVPWTL